MCCKVAKSVSVLFLTLRAPCKLRAKNLDHCCISSNDVTEVTIIAVVIFILNTSDIGGIREACTVATITCVDVCCVRATQVNKSRYNPTAADRYGFGFGVVNQNQRLLPMKMKDGRGTARSNRGNYL